MGRGLRNGRLARIGDSGLLWSFCKNGFKEFKKFADLRARDDKRRQEAKSKVVRAVDEQAALHSFGDKRGAFDGELNADHQPFGTDFPNEIELGGKFVEAFAQLRRTSADIVEKFFLFNNAKKFKRHSAGERASAKGGAMHPGRHT